MAQSVTRQDFDPYHKWLGIPPDEQPPNYYRLLGINLFEDDPEVIDNAADQRLAYLKTFAHGPHSRESQEMLNAVAMAKVCLLKPQQRQAYNARLRRSNHATVSEAPIPTAQERQTQFIEDNLDATPEIEPLTDLVPTDYFDESYVPTTDRPVRRLASHRRMLHRRKVIIQLAVSIVTATMLGSAVMAAWRFLRPPNVDFSKAQEQFFRELIWSQLDGHGIVTIEDVHATVSTPVISGGWSRVTLTGKALGRAGDVRKFVLKYLYQPPRDARFVRGRLGSSPIY